MTHLKEHRRLVLAFICAMTIVSMIGCGSGNVNTASTAHNDRGEGVTTSDEAANAKESAQAEDSPSTDEASSSANKAEGNSMPDYIELTKGEQGEYGREIVLDEGLIDETHEIAYYVPGGTYTVKSLGAYPAQINVFTGLTTRDDGASQWTGYGDSATLQQGETTTIIVPDGWLITTPSISSHLILIPDGSSRIPDEFKLDDEVNMLVAYDSETKNLCYRLFKEAYPAEDVNWDMNTWEWHNSRWDLDTISVIVEIPRASDPGSSFQAWALITPIVEDGVMTDGICHFLGLDVITTLMGFEGPDYYAYDAVGQDYLAKMTEFMSMFTD